MELNQMAPTHILTPSKPPVHIHLLSTYIYGLLQSGQNPLFPALRNQRLVFCKMKDRKITFHST